MGLSLRRLGKSIWEGITPQNEEALRRAEANLARSNQAMARPAQYGVLRNQQYQQQAIQNNQPQRFNLGKAAIQSGGSALGEMYAGGIKRFGQDVAGTVLTPYSNRLAEQEKERAKRLLTPSYENMYRAYGADPRLGANQADIEANMADYDIRTEPLRRSNIGVNDNVLKKVTAHAVEAGLDIATAGTGPTAFRAAKQGLKAAKPSIAAGAALGAAGNLAYTAGQDGASPLDYVVSGGTGAAIGATLPALTGLAGRTSAGPNIKADKPKVSMKPPKQGLTPQQLQVREVNKSIQTQEKLAKNATTPRAQERHLKAKDALIKERAILNRLTKPFKDDIGSTPLDGPLMPLNKLIPDGKKPKSTNPLESLKQEATTYYHGSTNDKLTSLQPGAKTGLNEKRNLIYLTDDVETAKPYTKNRGTDGSGQGVLTDSKTGKVYEVQVEGKTIGAYDFEELAKLKNAKGFNELSGRTKNSITNDTGLSAEVLEANPELRNFLTQNGYTNVKAHLPNGTGKSSEIIVLDPSKAKLSQPPKSPLKSAGGEQSFRGNTKELAETLSEDLKGKTVVIETDAGPVTGKVRSNYTGQIRTAEQTTNGVASTNHWNEGGAVFVEMPDGTAMKVPTRQVNGLKILNDTPSATQSVPKPQVDNGYVKVTMPDGSTNYIPKSQLTAKSKSPLTVEKTKPKVALKEKPAVSPQAPSAKRGRVDSSLNNNMVESKGVGLATEVKRGLTDKDQVILDELRNIEKQTGQKGLVDEFMYRSNMQRGSNARANVDLKESKNISEAIGGLDKGSYKNFSDYANARTELATAGKTVATSRPKADLEAIVKQGDAEYGARFKALNKHYKELANEAYKAGLISKDTLKLYKSDDNYIRIQRDMGELIQNSGQGKGNAYSIGQSVMQQKRKGSSKATLDAGEVAAEYTQQVYKQAARNRTATQLADVLSEVGQATKLKNAADATNQNVLKVMRDGKTEYYKVAPDIKEAIDNINPYHMNVVMQILAGPGRVLRAGVTGLNPVFIARNIVKDQFGSAINSDALAATHNPSSFFKGLFNASSESLGMNNNPLYKDFLRHYGDQTSFDLTRNAKEATDIIDRVRGGKAVGFKQGLKSPIRSLENFASITEKSTRFQNYAGAYKRAISEGLSKEAASEKAAIAAWQNSVDFSRAGTWGRVINTVIPYWNPATQGVRQMGRTFSKHPIKSGVTATALVGVPMVAATSWNLSNPETADIYNNIPEYEKENNLILIPPGTKQNQDGTYDVVKIPLPPGYKDAFMPIRRALEAYHNDKPVEGKAIASDIIQTVSGPVNFKSTEGFIGSFIPQAVKPALQYGMNQDLFTGKQTVPDYINEATDADGNPIPENKKAYDYTSGTARFIGNLTKSSPIKVEKAVKDIAGTVGLNVLNLSDQILANRGKIPQEQVGGQSIPAGFKRSFGSAQGIENANKSEGGKYYDRLKVAQQGLTQNELSAFNALHPNKKNFLGDQIYEADSTYNPAARLDIYNRFPKVFEADKKLDAANEVQNPLFKLEQWQVKKVLEKDNLPPGAKDPELSKLHEQDWYNDYYTQKSEYYTKVGESQKKQLEEAKKKGDTKKAESIQASMDKFNNASNKYPQTPDDLQKIMNYYSSLPKGTGARSAWIKSNPGQWKRMQDQFAAIDNWQNIARGKRGLDATEGDIGEASGYGDSSSSSYSKSYGGYGSGGSKSPNVSSVAKYAIDPDVGGKAPKASISVKTPAKVGVAKKTSGKPKVSIRKSLV